MKTALRLAAASLVTLVLVSCSGSVTVGGGKKPIKTWPTAEPLAGDMPVGRWRCYRDQDLAAMRETNSPALDNSCDLIRFKLDYEFLADGSGWTLKRYNAESSSIPSGAFTITGSALVYARDDEFRWDLDSDRLTLQRTYNIIGIVSQVNSNTFRFDREGWVRVFMRIGSPEHLRMAEFRQCVADNRGRNLFDVEDCGEPPDTGRE